MPARIIATAALAFALALGAGIATAKPSTSGFRTAGHSADSSSISIWGGYVATGPDGTFTSVSATWTEPTVNCASTEDRFAPWVGIDGWHGHSVEQQGVAVQCTTGTPVYRLWYQMAPGPVNFQDTDKWPVSAGDSIAAATVYLGSHQYRLSVRNLTKGWTFTTTQTMVAKNASAEAVIESGSGKYPDFGSVGFRHVYVNGVPIGAYGPELTNAGPGETLQARTGPLKKHGTAFDVSFVHE